MMTNKFTFIQFSLAGFVPSSLILPAKGSVYFPWNGRGPATQSSFKNKPLKRKTKEKEQKSDIVWLYRADPDAEFQAAGARGLFKCNTNSTIFGWFEALCLSLLYFQKTIKKENCPSCQKEELQRFNTQDGKSKIKGQKHVPPLCSASLRVALKLWGFCASQALTPCWDQQMHLYNTQQFAVMFLE